MLLPAGLPGPTPGSWARPATPGRDVPRSPSLACQASPVGRGAPPVLWLLGVSTRLSGGGRGGAPPPCPGRQASLGSGDPGAWGLVWLEYCCPGGGSFCGCSRSPHRAGTSRYSGWAQGRRSYGRGNGQGINFSSSGGWSGDSWHGKRGLARVGEERLPCCQGSTQDAGVGLSSGARGGS